MHHSSRVASMLVAIALLLLCNSSVIALPGDGAPFSPEASVSSTSWRITSQQQLALDGTPVTLSSDGQWIAGIGADSQLCVWEVTTLAPTCDVESLPILNYSIVWAPDNTAVAFTLDALGQGAESDLFVFELATGQSENLTPDGIDDVPEDDPVQSVPLDLIAAWSVDSRSLTFSRAAWGPESTTNTLMTIARTGGKPEVRHVIRQHPDAMINEPMFSLRDGSLVYSMWVPGVEDQVTGWWYLSAEGEERQLLSSREAEGFPAPSIVDVVEVNGTTTISGLSLYKLRREPEGPVGFTFDLETEAITPLELPGDGSFVLQPAGFSPDGSTAIAPAWGNGEFAVAFQGARSDVILIGDMPELEFRNIIHFRAPDWATNNTILIAGYSPYPLLLTVEPGDS